MGFDFVNARGKYHNVSQYSATAIREQEKGEKKRLRSLSEKLDRFNKIQIVVCLCVWYWDIHVISMIIIRHIRTPCKTTSIIYNFFVLMKHFSRHLERGRTYVKLTMLNYTSIHIQTEILWMEAAKRDCYTQLNGISLLLTDI